jgi:hypothetical protein
MTPPVPAATERPTIEFVEADSAEWKQSVRDALAELGLTYEQLAEQARTGHFTSHRARRLWVFAGGTRL